MHTLPPFFRRWVVLSGLFIWLLAGSSWLPGDGGNQQSVRAGQSRNIPWSEQATTYATVQSGQSDLLPQSGAQISFFCFPQAKYLLATRHSDLSSIHLRHTSRQFPASSILSFRLPPKIPGSDEDPFSFFHLC